MSVRDDILNLRTRIAEAVLGQDEVIHQVLLGLLANGHLLLESLPGLAKTRTVKALARNLDARMSRIQFTPDLLPSDITGAPAKVQAALLEAMEERQITVAGASPCPSCSSCWRRRTPSSRRAPIPFLKPRWTAS
ncbi:ATPase family associated with various cellular activities (AAA) [compost metagenome]